MTYSKKTNRILVWITSTLFIASLVTVFTLRETKRPVKLDLIDQPMLGNYNSAVMVTVFEDLMCDECQYFAEHVFPKLNEEYIKTGKISFKLIPISFLPYSKTVTQAAYCIYAQNQNLFWDFLQIWFEQRPSFHVDKTLQQVIRSLHSLDRMTYNSCISSNAFDHVLSNNLALAEEKILPEVEVPAVFVNGVRSPSYTYETVKLMIDKSLERETI